MSLDAMKQALEAFGEINKLSVGENAICLPAEIDGAMDALRAAIEQAQEPVAWMHNFIEGNVVAHRPADLDKHPDRWKALYKTPPSCPTCEALARAVMMDQTSHDMAPRQWQGLTEEDVDEVERWVEFKEDGSGRIPTQKLVRYIERKLKEKNHG